MTATATKEGVTTDSAAQEHAFQAAIRAFAEVAGALGELEDLDELLHIIARHICELVHVQRCSVYLRGDGTGRFRGQVGHDVVDIDARVKRLTAGVDSDRFTAEILRTKAPVTIPDALQDPRPIKSTMREWKVRSMMGVPMIVRGEVTGLIFLDDKDQLHKFQAIDARTAAAFADLAAVAIHQAQLTGKLRASLKTVARQNHLLRRATQVEDRLTRLVLDGGDIREIADVVSQLTGKPCAVYDGNDRRLATACPTGVTCVGPNILEPEYRSRTAVADALAALDASRGGVVEPLPVVGLTHRFMIAPIVVRDDTWGRLVLTEFPARFGAIDMHICRRAATNIAVEMSAERRAATAEWNVRASLAGELIRGGSDLASVQRRADYMGISLDTPRFTCLLTVADGGATELPDARRVAGEFVAAGATGVLATALAEGVAVLVESPDRESIPAGLAALKAAVAGACLALSPHADLRVGISSVCREPRDFERAYREAGQVVACLNRFGRAEMHVLAADDLGAGRLLLASANAPEVERFAAETLGPLLADTEHAADLALTLTTFFDEGRSIRRAATALDVHDNTIRYRLSRIEDVIGLPVATDADAQLTAQLAILVLRLQGRLAQRAVGVPAGA